MHCNIGNNTLVATTAHLFCVYVWYVWLTLGPSSIFFSYIHIQLQDRTGNNYLDWGSRKESEIYKPLISGQQHKHISPIYIALTNSYPKFSATLILYCYNMCTVVHYTNKGGKCKIYTRLHHLELITNVVVELYCHIRKIIWSWVNK